MFRAGDPGRDLFVVIDGELRVSIERDSKRMELDRAVRGDVIGEVGLFQGARTADVDALTDVRVLRLTPESLDRLCKRYPRIGGRVYRNLSEILAGRLARATWRV
jgi:CRP-like cAMP-binding protein